MTPYDRQCRAVAVRSTVHDKRRLKRIDHEIRKSKTLKTLAHEMKHEFVCRPDAEAAASRLHEGGIDWDRIETVTPPRSAMDAGALPRTDRGRLLRSASLIWNLIEHVLRQYAAEHNATLPGWDNKPTIRSATFMMSTKPIRLQSVKMSGLPCRLARPLKDVQRICLTALDLSARALVMPKLPGRNCGNRGRVGRV